MSRIIPENGAANGVGGKEEDEVLSQQEKGQEKGLAGSINNPPLVSFQVLQKEDMMDFQYFKSKMEELKNENRKSKIMAEKARHRSPQVKRSIGVLMGLKFDLEDVKEDISRVASVNKNNTDLIKKLETMDNKISSSVDVLDGEILANQMASRSRAGWKTVQLYEEESLFDEDDDAENKTKKFRAAERSAMFMLNKRRGGSNGHRRGGFGVGGSGQNGRGQGGHEEGSNGASSSGRQFNNFNKFSNDRIANNACWNCNLLGHHKKDCPKK